MLHSGSVIRSIVKLPMNEVLRVKERENWVSTQERRHIKEKIEALVFLEDRAEEEEMYFLKGKTLPSPSLALKVAQILSDLESCGWPQRLQSIPKEDGIRLSDVLMKKNLVVSLDLKMYKTDKLLSSLNHCYFGFLL